MNFRATYIFAYIFFICITFSYQFIDGYLKKRDLSNLTNFSDRSSVKAYIATTGI